MKLAIKYVLFALAATALNIGAQELVIRLYAGAYSLFASVLVGTGVGLVSKYVLDKMFIFNFRSRNAAHDAQLFLQYTAVGVVTTLIFWGFEFGFNELFADKNMRYVGAMIGLGLGYYLKYRMDKRFVFRVQAAM
jgi:putative flippase GtrA